MKTISQLKEEKELLKENIRQLIINFYKENPDVDLTIEINGEDIQVSGGAIIRMPNMNVELAIL